MPPLKPMLGDLELEQVQRIETDQDQVLLAHQVPALEGDFLQRLGRRGTAVTVSGVLTGPESKQGVAALREKFHAAEPVSFVADIATATRVDEVLIEELDVRELAGRPERFEYAFTLREFTEPPEVPTEPPPVIPPQVLETTLVVEVIAEGQPNFDFERVRVTARGQNGAPDVELTERSGNVWTQQDDPDGTLPAGTYLVEAVVPDDQTLRDSQQVEVPAEQTTEVTLVLRQGARVGNTFIVHYRFDSAFVEPCMRAALRRVAARAADNPDERLLIVGHTDKQGSEQYNQSLSERRARGVFAYLTFGNDADAAVAEWNELRRPRPAGVARTVRDTWGAEQYQRMLQDLGYYPGNITTVHDGPTDAAVRAFQFDNGLTPDGIVGDGTWPVLIRAYMAQDNLSVDPGRFLENCPGEILKWIGCGEKDAEINTEDAERRNRRTECLFIREDELPLPCQIPRPDTFDLPPNSAGSDWCLDDGSATTRCCFVTPAASDDCPADQGDRWCRQPAEPGTFVVRLLIEHDGPAPRMPLADNTYVLVAPDGQFMDGEHPRTGGGVRAGTPFKGRTDANGRAEYPANPKGTGTYTLEIDGPFLARCEGEPPEAARGNVVCKFLDGSADLHVIVSPALGDPSTAGLFSVGEHEYDDGTFSLPDPGLPGGAPGGTFTIRRRAIVRYPADPGGVDSPVATASAPYPLVVILHGRHRTVTPSGVDVESFRGLEYLARHLASHGYIALSIDAADIDPRADAITHRGELILQHIDIMAGRNATDPASGVPAPSFRDAVDMSRIGLVGHSRGGEGVVSAQDLNVGRVPQRQIRAIVSIAPTNIENLNHSTTPYLVIYGSSDGDVSGAVGSVNPFLLYDRAAPPKALIWVYGANHNRFSTNFDWLDPSQIDNDDPQTISEADHQNLAKGYALAFLERHLRGMAGFDAFFKNAQRPAGVPAVEVHHQFRDPNRQLVDNFEDPAPDATRPLFQQLADRATENSLSQTVNESGLVIPSPVPTGTFVRALTEANMARAVTPFFIDEGFGAMIAWDAIGATYNSELDGLNASGFTVLAFRITQRFGSGRNPAGAAQDLSVRLTDSGGREAVVRVGTVTRIPFPFERHDHVALHPGAGRFVDAFPDSATLNKSAFKTVRLPLASFKRNNSKLDLGSLATLSFEFDQTASGEVAIDDIEFSS